MSGEAELVESARAGSVAAFTRLVDRYSEGLLRFLATRTPTFADAEDALQDTFINAYRYLDSYDPRWRFSTWLYRIAINNAKRNASPVMDEIGDLPADADGPLAECIAAQTRENIWVAARRLLSDEVVTALWLRYVEDMSVNDIATVLERSVAWTKVNLHRGRRALEPEIGHLQDNERTEAYG
ncbi:MAG: sigma-70 family RNA polymerase sigma factor [Woeseiaceae bacterium]|nr:sigma-70 family RNA polymerase sigma factor [Woeseiaceae bacterium]